MNYEVRVAALIATKMLVGDQGIIWDEISGADVEAITMQAPEPVDDVVVNLRGEPNACVFISAKERAGTIPLTAKSPAFADTVTAFVCQFLKLPVSARVKTRLVWALPRSSGQAATLNLAVVLDSHRMDAGDSLLAEFLRGRQGKQQRALESLLTQARKAWKKETGKVAQERELRDFLRCVHVEVYEFECGQRLERQAESEIRTHLVVDPKQAKRAWEKLEHFFARVDQHGVRVTAATLRRVLVANGLTLKSPPNYAEDIAFLNELTRRNLFQLKEHTRLRFGSKPTDAVNVPRTEELPALLAAAKSGHHLITGEPGCGKSGLIHPLAESLGTDGLPVVLLLAEDVLRRDRKGTSGLPGLEHALDDVLTNWPDGQRGFLIIDALDALRDVEMQTLLRRLLCEVKDGQSNWTVLASVREFDLKHSRELREAFPGAGVPAHCSNEFTGVAHFHLTGFADSELDQLAALRPDIRPFIESARKNLTSGEIHHSPFFLRLAAELLRDGVTPARLADWNSPAVLLRKFWELRVEDGVGASERQVALQAVCRGMLDARTMALSLKEISLVAAGRDTIHELRSRGILQAPTLKHGTRVADEDIRFSHHLLHDYAIARSIIPTTGERFADFAIREPLLPVFYRQSFMFALEELWDAPAGADGFWSCALKLEGVAQLHGIARILAPLLAARRVESLIDLQPLLAAVAAAVDADTPALKALRHLASGLQDADADTIRAGAGAWCVFAGQLASLLPTHPPVEGPIVHIIARLNTVLDAIDVGGRLILNTAGRGLLAHHVAKEVSKGWRYAAIIAIEAICSTFDVALVESECALLSLMTPERLAQFPHNDLFDLAHKIQHLGPGGDTVVLRLFEAAFSTEPQPGEWENFGGAILPLRMQTRDNWNSVHYSLADYYAAHTGKNAGLMTDLACIAWNAVVRRRVEMHGSEANLLATIRFRGVPCDLIEDYGHVWGREFEHEENRILSHFEKLLREWAAAGETAQLEKALDRFAARNRTSLMWSVFMEVGAEHPSALGVLLEEVLNESLFLAHPNYSYGGTALLAALHKAGDSAKRERLERLILELPARAQLLPDEPREPTPAWLEYAQNRLLGALEESDIVLMDVRALYRNRKASAQLPPNRKAEGPQVRGHALTNKEMIEGRGIDLKQPANQEMFKLREALKPFLKHDGNKLDVRKLERRWRLLRQCERALKRHQGRYAEMAADLWGHLVGVCENTLRCANWPKTSQRWKLIRRILLRAANDPIPKASRDTDEKNDKWPSWGWPSPRLDAARGLPLLVYRLGRTDKSITAALRRFCYDKSHPLRFNFAESLTALTEAAPNLMWELVDTLVADEKMFSVLDALLLSLDQLENKHIGEVLLRCRTISDRVRRAAPSDNGIHRTLASVYLFTFLRTGDAESEAFIGRLVEECDNPSSSHSLLAQLHTCRSGGWLTAGDGVTPDVQADVVRARTWCFFARLLTAAQAKLQSHREQWHHLHEHGQPNAEAVKSNQQAMARAAHLVDGIAMQLYFASGAFNEGKPPEKERLSKVQLRRFWRESSPLLKALTTELHPHTAHQVVQTLHHLLPFAPNEAFLMAMKAISTSAEAGYQHESLAVGDVVALIQQALADHRVIFQGSGDKESECLEALLRVLDLFVEAGWPEARQLTHRLEEIYR